MQYSTPELVVIGSATVLVLGPEPGRHDNIMTFVTQPAAGIALDLDD